MMDMSFLTVVAVALCLLSGGIWVRLAAAEVTRRRIALAIVELWVLLSIWIGVWMTVVSSAGNTPLPVGKEGLWDAVGDFLRELPTGLAVWIVGGLVLSVAMAVHLMWSLSRAKSVRIDS